jgi:hypothetical protein
LIVLAYTGIWIARLAAVALFLIAQEAWLMVWEAAVFELLALVVGIDPALLGAAAFAAATAVAGPFTAEG